MTKRNRVQRLITGSLSATVVVGIVTGCGGSNAGPQAPPTSVANPFVGSYRGTYTATYHPLSPRSGTLSGPLNFTLRKDGSVVVQNLFPSASAPSSGGTGAFSGNQLTASGTSTFHGLRALSGQLRISTTGNVIASGTIEVASTSEVATGSWEAQKE